ncbi:MAG: DUF1592 domain-containing protein [Gemmataceae bacterium]|nr:DUF1592 domain-containing protein [Gemmataceae bacterium]MDW8264570.1 DUF1592 domain-containing protein [Gemmataceae bacterium]
MRWLLSGLATLTVSMVACAGEPFTLKGFDARLLPFVRRHCVECHRGPDAEGRLDLTAFKKVEDLLNNRKPWQRVVRQLKAGAMPPDGLDPAHEGDRRAVVAWLEQALVYVDPDKPPDPGRVTVRRLNRTEYNNTIRDLFGVSMPLADDFPADDLGYGFDNIGDVLSISPLRMEQYLNAAEKLTAALLLKGNQPIFDDFIEGGHLRHNGVPPRNSSDRGRELVPGSELYAIFEFPLPGVYEVAINAWGIEKPREKDLGVNERWLEEAEFRPDPKAKPPVEATFLCDDREIGHVPVMPGNATTALKQVYTVRFTAAAGYHTMRVRHRFSREMSQEQVARHLEKPLLAPRLGLRQIRVRGPFGFGDVPLALAHRALLTRQPTDGLPPSEAARRALRIIADRAWRRPATDAELDRLVQFFEKQRTRGRSFEDSLELATQTILISPQFLFRLEMLPPDAKPGVAVPVDDYALASRLSYFLWSSMPDDELLALASARKLSQPEVLAAQVERLLRDARSAAFLEGFFGQWLGLRKLPDVSFDSKLFPAFSTELREDLRRETELFIASLVRENRSALDLLQAEYTFVNGRLAEFYGIRGVDKSAADFRKVSLAGTPRQGILTHGAILMLPSYPNRTSPTRRGNWILETLLGEEPPPPPANVPELAQTQAAQPDLPLRKQLELHRTNALCASCHQTIDAIGFGLENFDAIGRWRDTDRGKPIDATGQLPSGESFSSPRELIAILAKREGDFARHLASRLLTYALGRGLEYTDRPAIEVIVERTRADRFRFQDMIREVVLSRPFRWQRPEQEERQP